MPFDISEKNAVINYAVQTTRIAGLLNQVTSSKKLKDSEARLFELASEFIENIIMGAYFIYKPEDAKDKDIKFISIRDFRINFSIFTSLNEVSIENPDSIINRLEMVQRISVTISKEKSIIRPESDDFANFKQFYDVISTHLHETMLANKQNSIENYSSSFWPERL